jgi:hypothetical protein
VGGGYGVRGRARARASTSSVGATARTRAVHELSSRSGRPSSACDERVAGSRDMYRTCPRTRSDAPAARSAREARMREQHATRPKRAIPAARMRHHSGAVVASPAFATMSRPLPRRPPPTCRAPHRRAALFTGDGSLRRSRPAPTPRTAGWRVEPAPPSRPRVHAERTFDVDRAPRSPPASRAPAPHGRRRGGLARVRGSRANRSQVDPRRLHRARRRRQRDDVARCAGHDAGRRRRARVRGGVACTDGGGAVVRARTAT